MSDFYIFVLCHFQETAINIVNVTGPFFRKCLEISFWPSLSALQALTGTECHASLLDKEVRRKWAGTHQREPRNIGRDSPPCTRSLRGLITEIQRKEENKKNGECPACQHRDRRGVLGTGLLPFLRGCHQRGDLVIMVFPHGEAVQRLISTSRERHVQHLGHCRDSDETL